MHAQTIGMTGVGEAVLVMKLRDLARKVPKEEARAGAMRGKAAGVMRAIVSESTESTPCFWPALEAMATARGVAAGTTGEVHGRGLDGLGLGCHRKRTP